MECGRGRVARDVDGAELELVLRGHRHPRAVAGYAHAGAGQHALGVVAAGRGLDHGRRARRQQAREQHARLHLRGGDRHPVVDPAERAAGHRERRVAILRGLDPGSHQRERRGHAVDRPAADRGVAVERPASALLPCEPPGQQPHQRAGVADVDRRCRGRRGAQAGAADHHRVRAALDEGAERLHGRQCRVRVRRVEVAGDAHRLVGHRRQQRRAVRERLVRRRGERPPQRPVRSEAHVHGCTERSTATGPPDWAFTAGPP